MYLLLAVFGISLLLIFVLVLLVMRRASPQSALLADVTWRSNLSRTDVAQGWWQTVPERLAKPLTWVRSLVAQEPNPEIVRRLVRAGYRKPFAADVYLGTRLALPAIAGVAVATWVSDNLLLWFALAVVTAFFLPEFWLVSAEKKRRQRIQLSLPDALDLLAICMAAGLGLDQAIVRIGQELKISHPELSEEFLQINLEQRAGSPRIAAWRNMAERVGVESVRSFVNMLVQTERFGTPVSKSLSAFSDALRLERRQKAEELAAKATIKLVLPLVFFIFPSIFIVTAAPAVITLIKSVGTIL